MLVDRLNLAREISLPSMRASLAIPLKVHIHDWPFDKKTHCDGTVILRCVVPPRQRVLH